MYFRKSLYSLFVCFLSLISCHKKEEDNHVTPKQTTLFSYPSYFPSPVYDFDANPLDEKKFKLGRMLFYDPILSLDSCISCSVCHQQTVAYSTLNHQFSHGINGLPGTRNAPGLFNLAWYPYFTWDGGILNLEMQPLSPISNPNEMAENLSNVLKKLNRHPLYKPRFKEAFEEDTINSQQVLKALAQYMVRIVSSGSKYDQYKQGTASFSSDELAGLNIVRQKCSPCHGGELFSDFQFRNIGLDSTALIVEDVGRELITNLPRDRRKYRTPSLRNITLTRPYFHDGRVSDINNTLLYHGQQDNPNLDPQLKTGGTLGIPLTDDQVSKIYTFLLTLADPVLLTDTTFSLQSSDFYPFSVQRGANCGYVH